MSKSPYEWTVIRLSVDEKQTVLAADFDELFFKLENQDDVIMVIRQEVA